MRLDHPAGLVAAGVLAAVGTTALWFALFNDGPSPYIGSASEVAALLAFLAVIMVSVILIVRRRA
ncbi:MAG: hypothetical protein ABEH59_04805 [Halobacteriales archaeon]